MIHSEGISTYWLHSNDQVNESIYDVIPLAI